MYNLTTTNTIITIITQKKETKKDTARRTKM